MQVAQRLPTWTAWLHRTTVPSDELFQERNEIYDCAMRYDQPKLRDGGSQVKREIHGDNGLSVVSNTFLLSLAHEHSCLYQSRSTPHPSILIFSSLWHILDLLKGSLSTRWLFIILPPSSQQPLAKAMPACYVQRPSGASLSFLRSF